MKSEDYPDTLYVNQLVVADTVNTMPEKTLEAFADHGEVEGDTVTGRTGEADEIFTRLEEVGVDFEDVSWSPSSTRASTSSRSPGTELVETVEKQMEQVAE